MVFLCAFSIWISSIIHLKYQLNAIQFAHNYSRWCIIIEPYQLRLINYIQNTGKSILMQLFILLIFFLFVWIYSNMGLMNLVVKHRMQRAQLKCYTPNIYSNSMRTQSKIVCAKFDLAFNFKENNPTIPYANIRQRSQCWLAQRLLCYGWTGICICECSNSRITPIKLNLIFMCYRKFA